MQLKEYTSINEQVYSTKLPNGLTIYVVPKAGFHKKFAFFATEYGGVDRRFKLGDTWIDTPAGVAHFLEHKMFDTENGNALDILSANGASPNAYTRGDMTAYYFECIDKFYENLEILLSFVSTPYFTEESVLKEQDIISQEIAMIEDNPYHNLYYGLLKSLFEHNPIRDSIAGTIESVSQITCDILYDCHKVFYNPSNMVLCVVGDIEPNLVSEIAQKILPETAGIIPERDYGLPESLKPFKRKGNKEVDISLPVFLAGCKGNPIPRGTEMLKTEIISAIALDYLLGSSSPLYLELYAGGLINTDFSASSDFVAGVSYTSFGGETRQPQKVFDEVLKEVERLLNSEPDAALFGRLKKAAIGSHIRALNSFEVIASGLAEGHYNKYDALDVPKILDSVTIDDIHNYLRKSLVSDSFAMYTICPSNY